jgi:hypothetical protein
MNYAHNINLTTLYAQTLFCFLKKIVRKIILDSSEKALTNEESLLRIIKHTVALINNVTLIELQENRVQWNFMLSNLGRQQTN